MGIIWDENKALWLMKNRGISFDEIASCVLQKEYKVILENPAHKGQMIFILEYKGYTHVVPFVIDSDENIVLKTVFPSRKFHKEYGGNPNENAKT